MTDSPPTLLTHLSEGVLTLTLNRPDKRNALDAGTIELLHSELASADLDSEVRVVAIKGAGKDFCAGADLSELLASADKSPDENEGDALMLGTVFTAIRELPKPVVAVTHGRTLAGGCGLATACDLVVAPASAMFGFPEIQRGFVPAMVMAMLRRVAGEKVAFDLAATGRIVDALEAERIGLVSRVFPDAEYRQSVDALLAQLSRASPTAMALTKGLFYQGDDMTFTEGVRLGARVNATARGTPDFKDAVAAFLNR